MEKKKFRISGKLIFNLAVVAISIYLIIYFFVSEDGLIDLLKKPDGCNMLIILAALLIYDLNILVDAVVTLIYVRSKYENFSFIEALKVAFVGVFFSAITPSSTGGQPMQLYLMSKKNISVGFGSACMTQKFIVYQIVMTAVSVIAVITRFNYFSDAFTNIIDVCKQTVVTQDFFNIFLGVFRFAFSKEKVLINYITVHFVIFKRRSL